MIHIAHKLSILDLVDVAQNLTKLSGYRTDIFGSEEVEIGRQIGVDAERQKQAEKEKVIWDGHTASIGNATRQAQQTSFEDHMVEMQRRQEYVFRRYTRIFGYSADNFPKGRNQELDRKFRINKRHPK